MQVGLQIAGTGQYHTPAHAYLKHEAELARSDPVVNHLHHRTKVFVVRQDERHSIMHQVPPLPVGVEFRGELSQGRVIRITQDTQGVGRLPAGPHRIPENAGEPHLKRMLGVVSQGSGRRQPQDTSPCIEMGLDILVDFRSDQHVSRTHVTCLWIDPDIPAIADLCTGKADIQREFCGPGNPVQADAQRPQRHEAAGRHS